MRAISPQRVFHLEFSSDELRQGEPLIQLMHLRTFHLHTSFLDSLQGQTESLVGLQSCKGHHMQSSLMHQARYQQNKSQWLPWLPPMESNDDGLLSARSYHVSSIYHRHVQNDCSSCCCGSIWINIIYIYMSIWGRWIQKNKHFMNMQLAQCENNIDQTCHSSSTFAACAASCNTAAEGSSCAAASNPSG